MSEHYVCLTFDLDNTSSAISRGLTSPTMISRGDFGITGTRRLLQLLAERSLRSTWFIPGHTIESYPGCARAVHAAGHEIAHHGWTHRTPASLGREGEQRELERGNEAIKKLTGRHAKGYRSPAWDLSPHSIELLIAHGFEYDSSMMGDDYLPYQARQGDRLPLEQKMVFGEDSPLIEMPISWHLDDYPHFEFMRTESAILPGLMNARSVAETWLEEFVYMQRSEDWGILTYTFHPHVIGRGSRMLALETMLARLTELGARFVTMAEAVDAYRRKFPQGRSLRSSP